MFATATERIQRLSRASLSRVIEPDVDLPGRLGPGAVIAPDLLSVAGLDLALSAHDQAVLSREEVAAIVEAGLRFEAVLLSGFALAMATAPTRVLTDARTVYALHEMGEETRHSRMFCRVLDQLGASAKSPLDHALVWRLLRLGALALIWRPALLDVLVLAGEEIPDLMQRLAAEHPGTDPFLVSVARYHRQEEARHLAYARTVLSEHWASTTRSDRFAVRHVAPWLIWAMFDFLVHPGVYRVVGLPAWSTWWHSNRSPDRSALRHEATRSILASALESGVLRCGRVPSRWRLLCDVDRHGAPR